jgi:hypothetical protein
MEVKDTKLYIVAGRINLHAKTKRPMSRLTDGKYHPVTIIKPDGTVEVK